MKRTSVNERIGALLPLNFSDVAKAAYAMKADDWSDSCTGEIDVYRTCGSFKPSFVLPFVSLASVIALSWLLVTIIIRNISAIVPVDTVAWRKHALEAIRVRESIIDETSGVRSLNNKEELSRNDDAVFHAHMLDPGALQQRRGSNSRDIEF